MGIKGGQGRSPEEIVEACQVAGWALVGSLVLGALLAGLWLFAKLCAAGMAL